MNVDLAASGVAFKERINVPVIAGEIKVHQLQKLKEYFRERLQHYRSVALLLSKESQ